MERKQLGLLLEEGMAARHWTVRDLAEKASVAYETARSAVRGLSSPSIENVEKLLNAVDKQLVAVPMTAPTPTSTATAEASAEAVG